MPELILEMRVDLRVSECGWIREFYMPRDRHQETSDEPHSEPRFSYFESEHESLRDKLQLLVDLGHLVLVRGGEVPLYRMTDEFAEQLIATWPTV